MVDGFEAEVCFILRIGKCHTRGSKYWTENFMKYEKGRRKVENMGGQLVSLVNKKVSIIFLPKAGERTHVLFPPGSDGPKTWPDFEESPENWMDSV